MRLKHWGFHWRLLRSNGYQGWELLATWWRFSQGRKVWYYPRRIREILKVLHET